MIFYISYFFALKITAPIVELNEKMIQITRDNWQSMDHYFVNSISSKEDKSSKDEILKLGVSFSSMIKKIYEVTISKEQADELRLKAQVSNDAKGVFLSNMSHEIRTPLHGIISFSKYGMEDVKNKRMDRLLEDFELIYSSADRLMRLLNDVLDLSKLESGKMNFSFQPSLPLPAFEQVCHEFRAMADLKGCRIIFQNVEVEEDCYLKLDVERLMQVMKNLIANAIKFSRDNGEIFVKIEKISSSLKSSLQVCVLNQGESIPSDELESIFGVFNQSSVSDKGSGGTGLGLSISKQIIQEHNGHIWCECENINKEKL